MKKGFIALIYVIIITMIAITNKPKGGIYTGTDSGGGYVTSSGGGGGYSGGGGGGPSGPASRRFKRKSVRHKKIAKFNPRVKNYQSDYKRNRRKNKYRRWYIPGTYKTSVIVYGGDVFVTSYDEKGPQYEKGYGLITGQKHSIETSVQ